MNLKKKILNLYKLTIDLLKYMRDINITKYILLLNNFFKSSKLNSSEFGAFVFRFTLRDILVETLLQILLQQKLKVV